MTFDSFDEVKVAFEAAQARRLHGDLLGAYDHLLEIFTYRLRSNRLIDADLKVIQSLAELAGLLGEFQGADDLLQGAISLYEDANSYCSADYARLRRIQLCLDRGRLYQARKLLQDMALRIGNIEHIDFSSSGLQQWEDGCVWPDSEPQERIVLFVELYLAMGRLLSVLGHYGDALAVLRRGLVFTEEKEASSLVQQTVIPLHLVIAATYLEKGNLKDANTCLTNIKSLLKEREYPEYSVRWLELSGKLNLLQGDLGTALEQFQQVQTTCRQLGSQRAMLQSTLNLAYVLILLNQTTTAQSYLIDTQVDALRIKDAALVSRTELLLHLARSRGRSLAAGSPMTVIGIRRRKKQDNQAMPEEQARLYLTQSSNYLTLFEDRALAFQWQLSDFDLDTAAALLKQIQEVFQFTDSRLIQVQIQVLDGIFAYYQGIESEDPSLASSHLDGIHQANKILETVCPLLKQMDLKPQLWQAQRILGWCRTRLNYPKAEIEALTASTNQLLVQLTESLSPEDQAIYLLNKWTADEEYIAAEINQLQIWQSQQMRSSFWQRPLWRLLIIQRLNALVEHVDHYKDVLVKRTIKDQKIQVPFLRAASVWRHLFTHPKDRITISFLILPDRIFIVRSGRFLFDFRVIPTTRLAVRNLVRHWYERIKGINGSRDISLFPDDDYDAVMTSIENVGQDITNKLAEILEIPSLLEDLPKHIKSLTIVPDDILHGFPFAAILHQGKYLIEHYALCIVYESKRQRSLPAATLSREKALVVGVSDGNNQFAPLPGIVNELDLVNSWLASRQIDSLTLENSSAQKAAIIQGLSQAKLLHIACHGTFEPNRPDHSGLVLMPVAGQQEIFSLRELSELNLTGLCHVSLSSCWSADHFILPGRWIISLPETLWRSGTQSILGCLWEVYDRVAASFMLRFYKYLDKLPRDEALRRTQLDCLHGHLPDCNLNTANPIFWAGFNLYGDYRTLKLSSRQSSSLG